MNQTAPIRRDLRPSHVAAPSSGQEDELFYELADKIETLPPDERRWILRRFDRQRETAE